MPSAEVYMGLLSHILLQHCDPGTSLGFGLLAVGMADLISEDASLFAERNANGVEGIFGLALMEEQLLLNVDAFCFIAKD